VALPLFHPQHHIPGSITVKLEGSLTTFPLRELIEMVVYSSVTGVLNISGPSDVGHLFFRDSVLYHVERGVAEGVDALAELFELSQGTFCFVSNAACEKQSLHGALETHLLAAERLGARWRQIRAYIPHLDFVPQTVGLREGLLRRVSPAHADVLAAVDGRANLHEIAARLGWSLIDTAEIVAQLSVDGVVELRTSERGAAQADRHAPHECPGCDGLFDRILARTPPRDHDAEARRPADAPQRPPAEDMILRLLRS
jgi:hypothetical protein